MDKNLIDQKFNENINLIVIFKFISLIKLIISNA